MRVGKWPVALLLFAVAPVGSVASDVYEVTVTREDQDLYKVLGNEIYIKTRYCYEYVYYDDAILKVSSPSGFTIGKIIFEDGESCDVAKLLK